MIQLIDLTTMLLLFLLGASIAMLSHAFQKYMEPQHIFNWYQNLLFKIPRYIAKPLGLCVYCNSVWITIIFFFIYFKPSFNIFLLIGITYYFVDIINKNKNNI